MDSYANKKSETNTNTQIEKDDVGKYIANVSAQNFELQDVIDAEVSAIKSKKFADACEARLEILKLRKPPPDKAELEMQEVKAVKARARAAKMEAKWKLLTLGQPIKKSPPPVRPILPSAAFGAADVKPLIKDPSVPPAPKVNIADVIAQKIAETINDLKNNEVEKIVVSQAEQETKVNQVYDALRMLDAKISGIKAEPVAPVIQPVVDEQMRSLVEAQDIKVNQLINDMQSLDSRLTADTKLLRDISDKLSRTASEEFAAIKQALDSNKQDGLNQKTNEDIAAIKQALERDVLKSEHIKQSIDALQSKELKTEPLLDKLNTLITLSADRPDRDDLIANSQEIADIKAALQSLLTRSVDIEYFTKNKELTNIKQSPDELANKPNDLYNTEQAKELSDIKQAVLQLIKAKEEEHKDNDCFDEINQIKTMLNNLNSAKENAENKQSYNFAEEKSDMKEEAKDLQPDIKQIQHEISDMKSNMSALLNHNNSFYFGQMLGKLDALGQSVGSLLGSNLNIGQVMGKLDALGLGQRQPQQPVVVVPGGQPQTQPIFFSTPQPAQPFYQQPQTTIVQQPPVNVGVNNYPDAYGNVQQPPVVNNYGQPQAYGQPQMSPYNPAMAPMYAQPQPSAYGQPPYNPAMPSANAQQVPPASAPAAAAATPPAESPVQKMLAEMAGRLDAMKGKK